MNSNLSGAQFGINDQILNSPSPFIIGAEALFQEVDASRPYEPTGMSTEKWLSADIEEVELDSLVGGQYEVSTNRVGHSSRELYNADFGGLEHPLVVHHNDRYYLEDGHHRVAAAKSMGLDKIKARVFRKT